MDAGALALPAGGPDIAAVVLDDLPHDGQADAAAPLGRVPGGVRAVEPLEYLRQVLLGDALAVVLNLDPDGLRLVQNPDIDRPPGLIHVLHAVADDIVDDLLHLLRIRDDHRVRLHQVGIVQLDAPLLQVQPHLLHAVPEIVCYVYPMEIIRNPVVIYPRVIGQLIDQPLHVVGLVVDGLDVFVHLLRRHRHPVHDALHIPLDGRDRGLQVMGDIADQLPVLLLAGPVLLGGLLQPKAHVLIIAVQIADLPLGVRLEAIIEVPLLDLAHGHVQLAYGIEHPPADPPGQHHAGKDQDQEDRDEHVHQQLFGNQGIHLGDHEGAPPAAVRKNKVQLLYEFVHLIVIDARALYGAPLPEARQALEDRRGRLRISRVVDAVLFPHDDVCGLLGNPCAHHVQIFHVRQPGRIRLYLLLQLEEHAVRGVRHLAHVLRHGGIVQPHDGESLLGIHQVQPDPTERQRRQNQRQDYDDYECDPQPRPEFHRQLPSARYAKPVQARKAAPPGQSSPCRLQLISTTISYFSQESVK